MQNRPRDVRELGEEYNWAIKPVGQLVNVGERGELQFRFCSGFNISDKGYFLTAGHCISPGNICSADGESFDLRVE